MENGNFRQSTPWLRGGQWASEHCVQKVEEMLSRAIVHQEDLLGLLTSTPEKTSLDAKSGHVMTSDTISPSVLRALKTKIENSMDWCHLALCRLREIVLHTSSSPSPSPTTQHSMRSSGGAGLLSFYSKGEAKQLMTSSSSRLNVPTPLSPLCVLRRKEPLSPHPFTIQGHSGSTRWNPNSVLFSDPAPHHPLLAQPGEDSSSQRRHKQQAQNFPRLPASLHMDNSDWPLLSEAGAMSGGLPPPLNPSAADPRQCSSSCQINPVVRSFNGDEDTATHYKNHGVAEDQSYINKTSSPLRGNRSRNASGKSEVRKLSGGEAKLEVVFQKLNDAKKGIPDDGHRGWKKYGNKSIQNSNHCRGYYKCSVKECRAKKMVQPTDKDSTLFEVTYVGKHTCSNTGQSRSRSIRTAACYSVPVDANQAQGASGQGKSPVAKEDDWKNKRGGMELDDGSILTGSNAMTDESIRENGWSGIIPGSSTCKRGRSINVEDDNANLDDYSYLHTMTTSITTTTSKEREQAGDGGDLHQSSRHHQAMYSFQDPLLWHDFDMDTNLSPGHKSVCMDSDSP